MVSYGDAENSRFIIIGSSISSSRFCLRQHPLPAMLLSIIYVHVTQVRHSLLGSTRLQIPLPSPLPPAPCCPQPLFPRFLFLAPPLPTLNHKTTRINFERVLRREGAGHARRGTAKCPWEQRTRARDTGPADLRGAMRAPSIAVFILELGIFIFRTALSCRYANVFVNGFLASYSPSSTLSSSPPHTTSSRKPTRASSYFEAALEIV